MITNGGGAGVLAADGAARMGVTLTTLTPELSGHLDTVLAVTWSHGNPILSTVGKDLDPHNKPVPSADGD